MAEGELNATGEADINDAQTLEASDDGSVLLPDGHSLSDAGFEMVDGDLIMSWPDGSTATVESFADSAANLVDSDGAQMSGDMAQQLAQIDVPAASPPEMSFDGMAFDANGADVIGGTDGSPIGNVEDVDGSVFAVRVDGTRVELNVGDPVFQGDILESGPDGSIGVILADETTFSMGGDGRMVLDEMVYDPGTQEGTVSLSVLEGVFTFVSGQVAKTDPDAMTLDTPVATIGIRGTQVGINLEDGQDMGVVLMEEGDGFVGEVVVQNDGGVVILNTAMAGTNVESFESPPAEGRTIERVEFLQNFGASLKSLPDVNNANTYGVNEQNLEIMIEEAIQQGEAALEEEAEEAAEEVAEEEAAAAEEAAAEEALAEELANFETAAGEEENVVDGEEELLDEIVEEIEAEVVDITLNTDPVISGLDVLDFGGAIVTQGTTVVTGTDRNNFTDTTGDDDGDTVVAGGVVEAVDPFAGSIGGLRNLLGGGGGFSFAGRGDGKIEIGFSAGTDTLNLAATRESIVIDESGRTDNLSVTLGSGDDEVATGSGNDVIYSGDGNDIVDAGGGDDIIQGGGGGGDDIFIGGEGADWVIYPSAVAGYNLQINLSTEPFSLTLGNSEVILIEPQTATDASDEYSWIDNDTLIDVENVMGGEGSDVIVGSTGDNILVGNLGSDLLFGGDGDDILIGGQVTDFATLESTLGFDGHDVLIGGAGFDTAMYGGSFGDYEVRIDQYNQLTITGPGGSVDTLVGIEEMRFDSGEVIAVGLPPVVSVLPAAGAEDTAIALNIDAALADGLGALANITISDIPEGSVVAVGTDELGNPITVNIVNGDAVLTPDQVASVTITPPENFADDFALTVTAEREIGFTSEPITLTVNVSPVADAPDVTVSSDNILVNEGQNATFDISAVATDASENITEVQVSGIPVGGKLFIPIGDGSVTVQMPVVDGVATIPVSLVGSVIIETPEGYDTDYDLQVSATSTESDGSTATTSVSIHVDIQEVDEPPVVTVTPVSGDEDTAIALDIGAVVDGGDVASVTISDIPDGAVISIGTDDAGNPITVDVVEGSVTLTPDQLTTLTITPASDDDTDFDLSVTATSGAGVTSDPVSLPVGVAAVADAPVVTFSIGDPIDHNRGHGNDRNGADEDNPNSDDDAVFTPDPMFDDPGSVYPLEITAALSDVDGSETLSLTISGIPDGVIFNAGTDNGDGTWSFTEVEIANDLQMFVPVNVDDDFSLSVNATATESENADTAMTTSTIEVDVKAEPDMEVVDVTGEEDSAIALEISAVVGGGEALASVTIDDIPAGAVISVGTDEMVPNADGTVTLTPDQLADLTITPPADSDVDFALNITATSTDGSVSEPVPLSVTVVGVADAATLDAAAVSGDEDTAIALDISAAVNDLDGSETLSDVTLSGIPDGSVISVGTDDQGNPVTVAVVGDAVSIPVAQLGDLAITPPADFNGAIDLSVSVTSIENDGDTATTSTAFTVTVDSVGDVPVVTVGDASGDEDTAIALDISTMVLGTEDVASVTITDIPEGAVISVGADAIVPNADGSVTLTAAQLNGLTIKPAANSADDFNLAISATSTDGSVSAATTLAVTIAAVADAPTVTLDIGTPTETDLGNVYPIAIDASLTDNDLSETLAITVSLVGAPDGATLSAGTDNGDGTWSLEPQQLQGLELTVPGDANVDFALEVTAVSTETENQDTATTTQSAIIDLPDSSGPGEGAIIGTDGSDFLAGGGGNDEIWGMDGHDLLAGQGGDDELHGGNGTDALFGEGGADTLFGDAGSDLLFGGGGNDILNGGADQDYLSGGGGNDIIEGGAGDDYLHGGGGADTFIFDSESGSDIIKDIMEEDTIVFEGQEFHAEDMIFNENEDGDVEISFQNVPETKVTLKGVGLDDIGYHAGDDGSGHGGSGGYSITEADGQVTITIDSDG